jgi:hypothetical protein
MLAQAGVLSADEPRKRLEPARRCPRERSPKVASSFAQASETGGLVTGRDHVARPMRTGQSSQTHHDSTTWGVRANRVGAKLSSRAIETRGVDEAKAIVDPWPARTRLGSRRRAPGLRTWGTRRRDPPGTPKHGQPRTRRPGIGGFAARARGSFWLQKSTNGAWPTRKRKGSSLEAKRGKPGGARGANGLRKPPRGGEAVRTVAGSRKGAFVDGRRSDPNWLAALTRRR